MKKYRSSLIIFIATFTTLVILFTVQFKLLDWFIDLKNLSSGKVFQVIFYWVLVAFIFTVVTMIQVNRRYEKPLAQFASATRQVANGDFSIYIPARHKTRREDFFDTIFLDFNKMVEELGSIETLKTEFFSNVSHEIKTPLSVIQNYAELLRSEQLTEAQRIDYTMTILSATQRLSGLITNMLKLNKIEKQAILPAPEPYDLVQQISTCALLFEEQWDNKSIAFTADIEDYATINADAGLLEIVWNNLFSNAVKFSEVGGSITLIQTSDTDTVTVSISDTGSGMTAETITHIFDKFYQGDTSHTAEGNGLGLALVQRIVELFDGTITVNSEIGVGSTFTVQLPVNFEVEVYDES